MNDPRPADTERDRIARTAQAELGTILSDWRDRHGLTWAESLFILAKRVADDSDAFVRGERRAKPCREPYSRFPADMPAEDVRRLTDFFGPAGGRMVGQTYRSDDGRRWRYTADGWEPCPAPAPVVD